MLLAHNSGKGKIRMAHYHFRRESNSAVSTFTLGETTSAAPWRIVTETFPVPLWPAVLLAHVQRFVLPVEDRRSSELSLCSQQPQGHAREGFLGHRSRRRPSSPCPGAPSGPSSRTPSSRSC